VVLIGPKNYTLCDGAWAWAGSPKGGKVVLCLVSLKKRGIQKNFDYSVLLACGRAYPGAGY
jgi:hypothetical protein